MKNNNFDTVVIGLRLIKSYKDEAAEAMQQVMQDETRTQEWKGQRASEIHREMLEKVRGVQASVEEAGAALKASENELAPRLDIMDERLGRVISITQTIGKDVPIDAQERIPEVFKGNKEALETILPILKRAEMHVAVTEAEKEIARISGASRFVESAADAAYYAANADGEIDLGGLMAEAQAFATIYGLDMPE